MRGTERVLHKFSLNFQLLPILKYRPGPRN